MLKIYKTESNFISSIKAQEVDQMAKMSIKNNTIFAECYQPSSMATFHGQDSYPEPLFKNALARALQMGCKNGLLQQGRILRAYATVLRGSGEYVKGHKNVLENQNKTV